ncbi:uncharacterized protein LOC111265819 isoform X2 [Varroa jacobsoni]|uniref:Beta-chimaerin n=1 Tax=Varroa destructor TaxID=109461 RepID=A0A7M7K7E4_VARDE|nr:uncharacterized protein LOC111249365 isoform X2 [Varroa destructor]XP_022698488.1 uncharacterized protein LOC111265819 isoform X2 [Varroa jacobsoni]
MLATYEGEMGSWGSLPMNCQYKFLLLVGSPGDINCGGDGPQTDDVRNLWKSYLYHMQQKAPSPKRIICSKDLPTRPQHYGKEYHGAMERDEAERLVRAEGEGAYLVRESSREPGQYSLVFLFDGQPKNYRLYYTDNQHYVGSKRFNTLQDLVADGLITMYLNTHAGEYIRQMCNEVSYEDSPYLTLNQSKKHMYYKSTRRRMKDKKPPVPPVRRHDPPAPPARPPRVEEDQPSVIDGANHQYDEPEFTQPPVSTRSGVGGGACSMPPLSEACLEELPEPPSDLMDSPPPDDLPKLRHPPSSHSSNGAHMGLESCVTVNNGESIAQHRRSEPQQPINRRSYVEDPLQQQHYQQPVTNLRRLADAPLPTSSHESQPFAEIIKDQFQSQHTSRRNVAAIADVDGGIAQERPLRKGYHHYNQGGAAVPSAKGVDQIRHSHHQHGLGHGRDRGHNRDRDPHSHQEPRHHRHSQQQQKDHHQILVHNHHRESNHQQQQVTQPQHQLQQLQQHQKELQNQQAQKQQAYGHGILMDRGVAGSRVPPLGFPLASLQDSTAWSADVSDDRVTAFHEGSPSSEADDERDDSDDQEEDLPNAKDFEKAHVFKVHNFMGLPWCDFCGNFMWGLIAQGVKCEDCGFSAHSKCSEKIPNDCTPESKFVKRVFGVDLTTLCKLHDMARPFVIEMCIKEVELRGMQVEGLYRVSGSKDEIEQLQASFEQHGDRTPLDIKTYEDINVVSGCLKNFFRLLPIPLITYDTYGMFVNAVRRLELDDKVDGLKAAVRCLPPAHYQSLKYLIQHLNRVTEHAKLNKMSADNLSRIFAPTLLRSPDSMGIDLQAALQTEAIVVETLIMNHRAIMERGD